MPFVFEQPNLGKPDENHLYFDPGDGRLLTVFTNESREDARRHAPREIGCVEHIAFNVSRATFMQAPGRLRERGIDFIQRDRGFMDSIYLHDPNGLKVELACYKFETPGRLPRRRCADEGARAARRARRPSHHRRAPRRRHRAAAGDPASDARLGAAVHLCAAERQAERAHDGAEGDRDRADVQVHRPRRERRPGSGDRQQEQADDHEEHADDASEVYHGVTRTRR